MKRAIAPEPRLRDASVRWLLFVVVCLQAVSWSLLDGYQIADSVEYMERAQAVIRSEEVIDSQQIRSFGFSALLLPFFGIADLLGVQDFRPLVAIIRVFQMLIGLGLVLVSVRLGARLGGRAAGLAAGWFVGTNPVFLLYSVSPLADVGAALCVGLAIDALFAPKRFKDGLVGGLWMGAALLMAYKTIPISAAVTLVVLLRGRRPGLPIVGGILVGFSLCAAFQLALDRIVYGDWGASLLAYCGENVIGIVARFFIRFDMRSVAEDLYRWYYAMVPERPNAALRQLQAPNWYWRHLPEMIVWPALIAGACALVRVVRESSWRSFMLVFALVFNAYLLSQKGSKEFRLWIPLLAVIGPLLGWGWAGLAGNSRGVNARVALAVVVLAATPVFSTLTLVERNSQKFSGYWRAMEFVSQRAAEERDTRAPGEKVRVASAYHWAVFLRGSRDIELTKLPHQLDGWTRMLDPEHYAVYDAVREQDWLFVHLPVLRNPGHEELAAGLNAWFTVEAVFWDRETFEDLGPIYVLRRKPVEGYSPGARTLFDVVPDVDPNVVRERFGFGEPVRLVRPDLGEEIWLLGFTYEVLPGDDHGWITYYFYCVEPCQADYEIVDRLTTYDERYAWQNDHLPAYGVHRTTDWLPGSLVREGWPVVAAAEPFRWNAPARPLGGAYRRGDLVPADLWLDFATFYWACPHCAEELSRDPDDPHVCDGVERAPEEGEALVSGRLERARFGEDEKVRRGELEGALESAEGWRFSPDGLSRVGRLFLPVHPTARVPDDGRPLEW